MSTAFAGQLVLVEGIDKIVKKTATVVDAGADA